MLVIIYFVPCVPAAVGAVVRGALRALRPAAAAPPSAGFTQQTDPTEEETTGGGEKANRPHVFLTVSHSLMECEVCTGVCWWLYRNQREVFKNVFISFNAGYSFITSLKPSVHRAVQFVTATFVSMSNQKDNVPSCSVESLQTTDWTQNEPLHSVLLRAEMVFFKWSEHWFTAAIWEGS